MTSITLFKPDDGSGVKNLHNEIRTDEQVKKDLEQTRTFFKEILQLLKEGRDTWFIMKELTYSKYGHEFVPSMKGIRDLHNCTKDMVNVVGETYDEYRGRPHVGYVTS